MTTVECEVCCEETKKIVTCGFCDYSTCVECSKRYLLSTIQEAHCMNCKTGWNVSFLLDNFTKSWVTGTKEGGYRHHRKTVNMELEKAQIPEVLAEIEIDKNNERIDRRIDAVRREIAVLQRKIRELEAKKTHTSSGSRKKEKYFNFVCPCPRENCRGLVEMMTYKCTVCDGYVCKRCREPKELIKTKTKEVNGIEKTFNTFAKHECNEETLQSIGLLREDTKPCPRCATPIHRISGCAQMWCPMCKVAFNWNTGREETGTIHNPHAVEWRRLHNDLPREPEDVPCGGIPQVYNLGLPSGTSGAATEERRRVEAIHRSINHLTDTLQTLRGYDADEKLRIVRKQYVRGEIDEKKWTDSIYRIQAHSERNRVKSQIVETLRDISVDAFRELQHSKRKNRVKEFLSRMEGIRKFINDTIKRELPPYGCKVDNLLYEEFMTTVGERLTTERQSRPRAPRRFTRRRRMLPLD